MRRVRATAAATLGKVELQPSELRAAAAAAAPAGRLVAPVGTVARADRLAVTPGRTRAGQQGPAERRRPKGERIRPSPRDGRRAAAMGAARAARPARRARSTARLAERASVVRKQPIASAWTTRHSTR